MKATQLVTDLAKFDIEGLDNFQTITEKVIQDSVNKINIETEKLVLKRIKEKVGIDLDIVKESKRTFPRIKIHQYPDNSTAYYWNDNTEFGLLLITFYQEDIRFEDNKFISGFSYK